MRAVARRALTVGVFAASASAILWGSGCEGKKPTEYVAGFSTQVVVPRDLKTIVVNVSVGGVQQFCRPYRVYDGKVQLPSSLGVFPSSGKPGEPMTVTVVGFTETLTETSQNPSFNDCVFNVAKVNTNNARVLRRSRQPYVANEVLFLPMPLKFSCFDKDCGDGEEATCKAGRCESSRTDETLLPKYTDDLLYGTGSTCFRMDVCFAPLASVPAVVVDPNDCTYALPNTASAPPIVPGLPPNGFPGIGDGINVEITFDGGYNREILDKDSVEGFSVPDATKPQRFRLGPGLCDMVKGIDPAGNATPHRITAVRAAGACRAKGPFQPICAKDVLATMSEPGGGSPNVDPNLACHPAELKPAPSALMVLADDTVNHHIFYESAGEQAALNVSLSDPAFRQTDIGLSFFPGRSAACGGFEPKVPMTKALVARDKIFAAFKERNPAVTPGALNPAAGEVAIGAAIADASTTLKIAYPTANRRALLVLGNRGFDASTCSVLPEAAASAARANGVDTYVIMLARDDQRPDQGGTAEAPLPSVVPGADAVAVAGTARAGASAFDARATNFKSRAQDAFRQVVDDLATCAYDVTTPLGADDVLSYSNPVPNPVAIPPETAFNIVKPAPSGTCTTVAGTGDGWGVDAVVPTRVRICGPACDAYRKVLKTASAYALQYQQPAIAVPVFSHTKACAPK